MLSCRVIKTPKNGRNPQSIIGVLVPINSRGSAEYCILTYMKKRNIFLVLFVDSEKVLLPLVACCCLRRPTERSSEWSLQTALNFIYFHGHQMVFDSFMHQF